MFSNWWCGDSTKAKNILGWEPKISFAEMMNEMADYWLEILQNKKLDFIHL